MTDKIKSEYIKEKFEALRDARVQLNTAAEIETRYHRELEIAKGTAIINGLIEGKNVAERDANARKLLEDQYDKLETAQENKASSILVSDIARMEIDEIKTLLRVAELPKE